MLTETLFQILLVVGIVSGILFIVVFCRFYDVLADVKSITKVVSKRVNEIDAQVAELQITITKCIDMVKSFMHSFDFFKNIKNKISNIASQMSGSKGGDNDEE